MKQIAVLCAVALAAGCQTVQDGWSNLTSSGDKASAVLQPTKGHTVKGTVSFVQGADRVRVSGAVPAGAPHTKEKS